MNPVTLTHDFADAVVVYGALTRQLPTRDALLCVLRGIAAAAPVAEPPPRPLPPARRSTHRTPYVRKR